MLEQLFDDINQQHFGGRLLRPVLSWNSRLRSAAGRFIAFRWRPEIQLARYLLNEAESEKHLRDTMGHEMIHYWLWRTGRPFGHTAEFKLKMRAMGVSRYNQVPIKREPKFVYECPECLLEYPRFRRARLIACGGCCKKLNRGKFDLRFKLRLKSSRAQKQKCQFPQELQAPL